jgi:hypothetical protein
MHRKQFRERQPIAADPRDDHEENDDNNKADRPEDIREQSPRLAEACFELEIVWHK